MLSVALIVFEIDYLKKRGFVAGHYEGEGDF